mmetsp:Transcript_40135/g.113814  ORF Transcript_40135/g.113814 Transcript_40135/m.113814 type:complete len:264 (+) Transcript_40135:211-1002(+)
MNKATMDSKQLLSSVSSKLTASLPSAMDREISSQSLCLRHTTVVRRYAKPAVRQPANITSSSTMKIQAHAATRTTFQIHARTRPMTVATFTGCTLLFLPCRLANVAGGGPAPATDGSAQPPGRAARSTHAASESPSEPPSTRGSPSADPSPEERTRTATAWNKTPDRTSNAAMLPMQLAKVQKSCRGNVMTANLPGFGQNRKWSLGHRDLHSTGPRTAKSSPLVPQNALPLTFRVPHPGDTWKSVTSTTQVTNRFGISIKHGS